MPTLIGAYRAVHTIGSAHSRSFRAKDRRRGSAIEKSPRPRAFNCAVAGGRLRGGHRRTPDRVAHEVFSTSVRRLIISSVIGSTPPLGTRPHNQFVQSGGSYGTVVAK